MTDEKKTPSFEEITHSFYEKCHCCYDNDFELYDCSPCEYCKHIYSDEDIRLAKEKNINWKPYCNSTSCFQGECANRYIYEVATGQRDINKPLWNPPKEELPKWFQDGVLVFDEELNRHLKVIDYETQDDNVVYATFLDADGETHQSGAISYKDLRNGKVFKPIKFRPYETLNELSDLLGKRLKFVEDVVGGGVVTTIEIVYSVGYETSDDSCTINSRLVEFYTKEARDTTIDGLPIGVPVVDEELLSNP